MATAPHVLVVSGVLSGVDNEFFGTHERMYRPVYTRVVLSEDAPQTFFTWSEGWGGECRLEVTITAQLNQNRHIFVTVNGKFYEGTSEATMDLADEQTQSALVPKSGLPIPFSLQFFNREPFGGDTATISVTFVNVVEDILLIDIRGLWYHRVDAELDSASEHTFMHLVWKPDISTLTEEQMHDQVKVLHKLSNNETNQMRTGFFELLLHKMPSLRVVEFSMLPFSESVGLDLFDTQLSTSKRDVEYHFQANNAATLFASQETASNFSSLYMSILKMTRPAVDLSVLPKKVNVMIIRIGNLLMYNLKHVADNVKSILDERGYFIVLWSSYKESDNTISQILSGAFFDVLMRGTGEQ
ncbi:hypothetical protein AFLA70_62g003750 [Aspergillus flavus AF70]|nr:hypothetical protein AFLA70_62g003750 [Aspergillus flavus AF70]